MIKNTYLEKQVNKELHSSEIIISWSQLTFSLFILALWLVSLFARQHAPNFEVVPYILSIYITLSIGKLFLAYTKKGLSSSLLILSILLDITLVTGLIWSFHIQYMELPGLSLKSPSFIYYFFFIVIRSLRYEVKYILIAGVGSIISWLSLVSYALMTEGSIITRSFIQYTKSHDILIGAEIEKVVGLFLITCILSITISRKRKLLLTSKKDELMKFNMSKFFSEDVVKDIQKIDSNISKKNGVVRTAGILMVDLRNFTSTTSDWPASQVLSLISDYQDVVVPIILKNNGSIDKYMGDGIFAHFGASNDSKLYAKNLLSSMEEIHDACLKWSKQRSTEQLEVLDVGQASSIGSIVFGTTGSNSRLEYTTIGNTVNNTAKLEKYTKTLKVRSLTTKEAYDTAKEQGFTPNKEYTEYTKQRIEGIKQDLDLLAIS